jgi:hypothetical protein
MNMLHDNHMLVQIISLLNMGLLEPMSDVVVVCGT